MKMTSSQIDKLHHHTHSSQTYDCRLWLIVLVNLRYSLKYVHACLPLCEAMSQHFEEP